MKMLDIAIVRDDPRARIPSYAHPGDAGVDLHAVLPLEGDADTETVLLIAPGARAIVSTGLRMIIPPGWELQIRPRSGLAVKRGITVLNTPGTIDSPYRGVIAVCVINHGGENFEVRTGDRIAQGVFSEVPVARFREVSTFEDLEQTTRGNGGFGSTGMR